MPSPRLVKGDKVHHRFNRDLGPGRVEEVAGRRVVIAFPRIGARLTFAAADTALRPVVFETGDRAVLESNGEEVTLAHATPEGFRLSDGRVVRAFELWPLEMADSPADRLAAWDLDRPAAFRNRLDGLILGEVRKARGLGSFLGGRVALYPHQLYVAERATAAEPVRWLLADEVGLGKTIEACLILSRLLRTERADRTLVIAPSTLTVQWLGELWRKFHQTFVLLDKKRLADVVKEHGASFNPFEAHRRAVVALEDLAAEPKLAEKARESGVDLLVVDEAHRLEKRKGDLGSDAYRAVAPLVKAARHVLLLSATPLEADTHGFFELLRLLRPDAYESEEAFLASLEHDEPLPPCTSATRRVDMGGLPPREPVPVDLDRAPEASGLTGDPARDADDPRVEWLLANAPAFARGGSQEGKTLVFCHEIGTLAALKARIETVTRRRVAIFHEALSPDRRDLEVAEFRRPDGPSFLISTECGGEGRNFEFCRRLVLFDLPPDPASVEQRIGRLDRISRKTPVEVVYFRPPEGFGLDVVTLYERIGLFREPLGGLERSLSHVEKEIRRVEKLARTGATLPVDDLVTEVRRAAEAGQRAVYRHLHLDGYTLDRATSMLARVPSGLDAAMERFVLDACAVFGFDTREQTGPRTWYVEFGSDALVEHLPGVPGGSRFLGTFDREEAVRKEDLDFFASGHPLVEALFQELEDGGRGRAGLLRLERSGFSRAALVFLARLDARPLAIAFEPDGTRRDDLGALVLERRAELRRLPPEEWRAALRGRKAVARDWTSLVRTLGSRAATEGTIEAAAGVLFTP